MDSWALLLEIVVLLAGCVVLGAVASRFGQSPLVAYLLAGMVLGGPGSLGIVQAERDISAIAELGVSLLLFSLGLEFSWSKLKKLGRRTLVAAILQVTLTMLAVTGVVIALGYQASTALGLGAMLSLSSTAAVLRILHDLGEIDSPHGRNSVAILLVQDMAVVPLAVLMLFLEGGRGTSELVFEVGQLLILSVFFIGALYLVLRLAALSLGRLALERNRELSVLLAVVVGLGATWAAHAVGLSPALGAFVAGMFLGASPFATQIRSDISSLRVVLLTLFFSAVGMVADPVWILQNLTLVLAVSAAIMVGKALLLMLLLLAMRWRVGNAAATAIALSQVGEFAFVLGTIGTNAGVISEQTYNLVVSAAIVTLLAAPYTILVAPRVGRWLQNRLGRGPLKAASGVEKFHPDVLIVGFGPAGQAVGRALSGREEKVLVMDLNEQARVLAESMDLSAELGDAQQRDVLEHASIYSLKVAVITIPSGSVARIVLENIRAIAPQAELIVRSRYHRYSDDLRKCGAYAVVDEEEEVGRRLSQEALALLPGSAD